MVRIISLACAAGVLAGGAFAQTTPAPTVVLPDLTSDGVAEWPDDHTERSGLRQEER